MISVIICSVDPEELQNLKQNIAATIGIPHEIIAIDNRGSSRGICAVYNEGTRLAKYDLLCFMHEDIEMQTPNWGSKLAEIFEANAKLGLLGVAGGGYKSLAPASWYNADLEMNGAFYCHLIQGFKYSGREEFLDYRNPKNEKLSRVAAIDGCWMCTTKRVALENPFDSALLRGFHGYDTDLSVAVSRSYDIAVTYEILLRHFSEGAFSRDWEKATIAVHEKWSSVLPVNAERLDEAQMLRYERRALKKFFSRQLEQGISYRNLCHIIWKLRHSRLFKSLKWYKMYVDLWRVWKEEGN